MDRIEPKEFDIIVVGSGIVEGLLAGALVKAGKSVLLIDQTDVYGSDEASFTLAGLLGSTDPQLNPNISPLDQQDQQLQGPAHELPSPAMQLVCIPRPALPITAVEVWSVPGADLGNQRGYILDLAPKVLYQAEPMVDVLVSTRAHNYLEFKAVDGSFIWCGSAGLRRVPASRADIFRDRSLGLADKRTLMSTITACLEAYEQGSGRLMGALVQEEPLAQVLRSEGLSPLLQDVVLYGIAMADWAQQPQQPAAADQVNAAGDGQQQLVDGHRVNKQLQPPSLLGQQQQPQRQLQQQQQSLPWPMPVPPISVRSGCASLAVFTQSLGRFGAAGAFMAPSYGAGSLPEALVRHAAVHGAVTALRQALVGLVLGPEELRHQQQQQREQHQEQGKKQGQHQQQQHGEPVQPGASDGQQKGLGTVADTPTSASPASSAGISEAHSTSASLPARAPLANDAQAQPAPDAGDLAGGQPLPNAGGQPSSNTGEQPAPDAGDLAVLGCLTAGGQLLRCKEALVAGPRVLSGVLHPDALAPTPSSSTSPPSTLARAPTAPPTSDNQGNNNASSISVHASSGNVIPASSSSSGSSGCPTVLLSRALVILDAPLHAGESTACLVLPPHTPGCGNPHPIRGLLSAPSLFVTPSGRFLLHLSTPSTPRNSGPHARLDLERAVQQLAECEGLLGPSQGTPEEQGSGQSRLGSSEKAAEVKGSGQTSETKGYSKPRALQVHYYVQQVTMPAGLGVNSVSPVGASASSPDAAAVAAATAAVALSAPAFQPPLPKGIVCCPGPSPSMAGYTATVEAARHMLVQHFPGVPWLGERSAGSPEDGEEADREGGAGLQEPGEDVEAIMALQASVDQLRAHQEKR